ncbi:hypothetical protein ONS95_008874 [Cadophora gregata]|uniref:uncharacterized protein n=1 Tax=Cadophora gregata TaxID=51156 RepID=UPI0026DC7DBE|nr:uncharacterized protein ONS95_008874 [Cadophora gregata]KAK0123882.1 hypothetical protein ONS95_008874 [Cadophora gregata]KAK0130222.1 hypothetical protein ONS96_000745 [Cadophora gregata f. sp. sojae]
MAKSAEDLALLMDVLVEGENYTQKLVKSWNGMRIGFVDDKLWSFVDFICTADPDLIAQQRADYRNVKTRLRDAGVMVQEDVPFPSMDDLNYNGEDALEQLWNHDFAAEWAAYLEFFDKPQIRSIADMVEFNNQNADKELPSQYPGQQLLELSLKDKMTETQYKEAFELVRLAAKTNGVDKTLADFDLDVIVGPMDGRIPTIAAAAGCPVGTVPLGYSPTNGRPYGLAIVAAAGKDDHIIKFMSAWDATMPKRKPPPQMVEWAETLSSKV